MKTGPLPQTVQTKYIKDPNGEGAFQIGEGIVFILPGKTAGKKFLAKTENSLKMKEKK